MYRTAPLSDAEAIKQSMKIEHAMDAMDMDMDAMDMEIDMDETTAAAAGAGPLVVADNENISSSSNEEEGWWRQCLFVRNGRRVPTNWRSSSSSHNSRNSSNKMLCVPVGLWPCTVAGAVWVMVATQNDLYM